MRKTILLAFALIATVFWGGTGTGVPTPLAPGSGSEVRAVDGPARFVETPTRGLVRVVTAYNVGARRQTDDNPCIGATGENLCRLVARGLKVCAANFVAPETVLRIEGYGECVVLDRMSRRFPHRVDIAMREDEADRALEFGVQRRHVDVKTGTP